MPSSISATVGGTRPSPHSSTPSSSTPSVGSARSALTAVTTMNVPRPVCPMIMPIGTAISSGNQHRDDGVLQVLADAGGQAGRSAPVGRGEDVGQRLLQEVHCAAALARTRAGRAARIQGVRSRPATMMSVSTTIASTKMAMIPAMIWSLLSA